MYLVIMYKDGTDNFLQSLVWSIWNSTACDITVYSTISTFSSIIPKNKFLHAKQNIYYCYSNKNYSMLILFEILYTTKHLLIWHIGRNFNLFLYGYSIYDVSHIQVNYWQNHMIESIAMISIMKMRSSREKLIFHILFSLLPLYMIFLPAATNFGHKMKRRHSIYQYNSVKDYLKL